MVSFHTKLANDGHLLLQDCLITSEVAKRESILLLSHRPAESGMGLNQQLIKDMISYSKQYYFKKDT
jgi:hypothetical protein